jgi:hypothetical protein
MSQQPISRSADLKRLRDDGYDVEIRSNLLLVKDVPCVSEDRQVAHGILASDLELAGDVATSPKDHTAYWFGEYPCDRDGARLNMDAGTGPTVEDLGAGFRFSRKPANGYADYYEKMTTYVAIISSHARALDPSATATTFPPFVPDQEESVFNYLDTWSSRAGIGSVNEKLALSKVAIVGVGGSGSYVLDLVAKTPVQEIHLFDGDDFLTHNAFRAPGAPSIEALREHVKKVHYFRDLYSQMRRRIVAHDVNIDESNVGELNDMSFIFLCMAGGDRKRLVVDRLEAAGRSFIDAGIGAHLVDNQLAGALRVTTSVPENRQTFRLRTPLTGAEADDVYNKNIQIADLNALVAALAVLRWKKIMGFYHDFEGELSSSYVVETNAMISDRDEQG